MKQLGSLLIIGFFSGTVLLLVLKIIQLLTRNQAYVLLTNFDYIPYINKLHPEAFFGYLFHYITCLSSVVGLYFILKSFKKEKMIWIYVWVYAVGGGGLFFLTALSAKPPEANDLMAWVYWTTAHALFGYINGKWIQRMPST